jgi:predicted ATPase
MLTRIEIDGFKTFENFVLDLQPFSAVVGPNASGKSNLFDALKFLSLLSLHDIRTAMQDLRGEPEELFRLTPSGPCSEMHFAIEVALDREGRDAFGTDYEVKSQRLRYELSLKMKHDVKGQARGTFVAYEFCAAQARKKDEKSAFLRNAKLSYSDRRNPFIETEKEDDTATAFIIRQDGPSEKGGTKRGRGRRLPATEASRTALSTITTAEFPHLYALRDLFASTRFLEINPQAARKPSDRFEERTLRADASNLAAVLAHLRDETRTESRSDGVISDISADLATLIPSVRAVEIADNPAAKEYSFGIVTSDRLQFSSRVISDGTLRLLALLAILDDPERGGILCFEEPENGIHEGRIPTLIGLLRGSVPTSDTIGEDKMFQVLVNTHSPAVMAALQEIEIVAADSVSVIDPVSRARQIKTRMRRLRLDPVRDQGDFNWETDLTRQDVTNLLRRPSDQA